MLHVCILISGAVNIILIKFAMVVLSPPKVCILVEMAEIVWAIQFMSNNFNAFIISSGIMNGFYKG